MALLIRGRVVKEQENLHGAQGWALVSQPWCLGKTTIRFRKRIQTPGAQSQLLICNSIGCNRNHRKASEIIVWPLVHTAQNNFKQRSQKVT